MISTILKKSALYVLIAIGVYLSVGYLFHALLFPEQKPEVSTYFRPGEEFYSKAEGFRQKVLKQENGFVYCTLEIEPYAGGPPKHIHADFDETFEVANGELTLWVNGEIKKLKPGESVKIPKGTPHKPYNETTETIHVKGTIAFPEKFAYHLPQVYRVMDNNPGIVESPGIVLQMTMFTTSGFDSYAAEGPPVFVQKTLSFLLAPVCRLLGYKSYYKEYDTHLPESQAHLNKATD